MNSLTSSIIVTAYNEEHRIETPFRLLLKTFKDSKILVVMDGCTDHTKDIIYTLSDHRVTPLVYKHRLGKGGAIMKGLKNAKGNIVAIIDADGATPPKELHKLIREIDHYDLVIGSRYLPESNVLVRESLVRIVLSRLFNALIKLLFRDMRGIMDTQCGAKVFRGSLIETVKNDLFITDFSFDVNLIYSALRHGLKVKEVGITWKHIEDSSKVSSNPFKLAIKMFLSVVRLRIYYSRFKGFIDYKIAKLINSFYQRL